MTRASAVATIDSEQACVVQQCMPLAGIGEDAAVVRFNPQCKPPLACGVKSAGRVFNNCGDIQIANHVRISAPGGAALLRG